MNKNSCLTVKRAVLLGVAAIASMLTQFAAAAPATVLWFQSAPGDAVANGRTVLLETPTSTFTVDNLSSLVTFDVAGPTENWRLALSARMLVPLAPGAFEDARHTYSQNSSSRHGIAFSGDAGVCDFGTLRGRFTVLEAVFNPDASVQRFAANFEQRCQDGAPPLFGEIRINSEIPLTSAEAVNSTVPDAFAFAPRTLVPASVAVVSNPTSIYGINAPAAITVTVGQYSINGGPFTSAPGTISNMDRLQLRVTSSATPGGVVTAGVTVGGVAAAFVVTTYLPGQIINGLRVYSAPGEPVFNGENREFLSPPDFADPFGSAESIQAGFQAGVQQATVRMYPRFGTTLAAGVYEETRGVTDGAPVLDVVSELGTCPAEELRGRFTIMEVAFNPDNTVANLAANFEQRCGAAPPLYGEIRINTTVPFSVQEAGSSTAPDPFAFRPRTLMAPGVLVESGATTIYGINAPAAISITGGEYSVNGGTFTSAAGTIANLDRLVLRTTSSATAGATVSAAVTVGGVTASFDVTTYQPGQTFSGVRFQSFPGDTIGLGRTVQLASPPDAMIAFTQFNVFSFHFSGLDDNISTYLSAKGEDLLQVGAYENVAFPFQSVNNPGLLFIYNGNACESFGRFVVLEVAYTPGGEIDKLAANLESRCAPNAPPLYGEIRINSAIPFSIMSSAPDTTPDAFAFKAQSPVRAGTVVTSNTISVYGVNVSVPISITGGEYSVNGAAFTSAVGMVSPLDQIVVRTTASMTAGATTTATLNIGGVSGSLTVQTYQAGAVLNGLYFQSTPGDFIGQGETRLFLAPTDTVDSLNFGSNQVSFDFTGDRGIQFSFDAVGPNDARLVPGVYENALRAGSNGVSPGFDFYGDGRGCNTLSARFVVYEINYLPDDSIDRFAADFEQYCDGSAAPLFGEIRFNSTIPFSALQATGPATRNLTVSVQPTGLGAVYSNPSGISCPGTCSAAFADNTTVTLIAAPHANVAFAGWTGCASTDGLLCTVSLTVDGAVTATFVTASNVRGDVDGDGKSDVVWYHTGVGGLIGMSANGLSLSPLYIIGIMPDLNWKVAGLGDLNGDGRADVVWRNVATGAVYGQLMNGSTVLAEGTVYTEPNLAWKIEQIADLDGDDKADLVWKNGTTGEIYVMKMDGLTIAAGQVVYAEPNLDWKIITSGDMDGDGKADLLWRNQTTGDVFAMLMNGFTVASGGVIYSEPNTNWKIIGLADFNGDGKADLLWQNTATGDVYQMQMDGTTVLHGDVIYNETNTAWKIVALGDYNGDGKADILWQNSATGQVYMMLMDSYTISSAGFVYTEPDVQWRIVGP